MLFIESAVKPEKSAEIPACTNRALFILITVLCPASQLPYSPVGRKALTISFSPP